MNSQGPAPGEPKVPPRAILYVDDSGIGGATGVTLLSGLLAATDRWTEFSKVWQAILDEEPAVSAFHMTDAFGRRGNFARWSQDERNRRFEHLTNAIIDHVLCSCTVYLATADYDLIVRGRVPKTLDDPFHVLFTSIVAGLFKFRQVDLPSIAPIDIVFDYQEQFGRKSLATVDDLWPILRSEETGILGTATMRKKGQRIVPLEAADMVAWCQHRKATKPDGQHLAAYRKLLTRIPRNHSRADVQFLRRYVREGFGPRSEPQGVSATRASPSRESGSG